MWTISKGQGRRPKTWPTEDFAKFEDDIQMIIKLQVLSIEDQKTLMNRFVSTSLWPLLELGRGDRMEMMIKK